MMFIRVVLPFIGFINIREIDFSCISFILKVCRAESGVRMRSRLDEIPTFEIRESLLRAQDFNLVRIALKRLGTPIRIELPRLRTLDFIFEKDVWVIVDRSLNDIPVIAWLDFSEAMRNNLHEPIACQQRSYHTHARIIIDKAFEAMHLILGEKLSALEKDDVHDVVAIKRPHSGGLITT